MVSRLAVIAVHAVAFGLVAVAALLALAVSVLAAPVLIAFWFIDSIGGNHGHHQDRRTG